MSHKTAIQFKKEELQELLRDPYSQLILKQDVKHQVALTPNCLADPEAAIYAILNRDLMTYLPKHKGILLSYKKVRRFENTGSIKGDNYHIFIDVLLDLYIFAPTIGCILKGIVNKKSPDGIGCLVHKGFNVAIPRPWGGTHNEWSGSLVQIGQDVMLQVEILNFSERLPYIRGKLVSDEFSTVKIHKKKKKSKDKLQAIESDHTEMESDKLAVSDEVPLTQSKKKKSIPKNDKYNCSLSETSSNVYSTADEVSAMLKSRMNKESKKKSETEPSLLPQMHNDVSTVMDEFSPKKKKRKSKDKLEMEQSSMSMIVEEEVSSIQKKKKRSKEKLEIEQSLLSVTGTMETTVIATIPNEKKRKKSKYKSDSEQNVLPSTSNLSTIGDESSSMQKKQKRKSKDKLEVEQKNPSETSAYLHLPIHSKTKHSDITSVCDQDHVSLSNPIANKKKAEEILCIPKKRKRSLSVEDTLVSSGTPGSITNTHKKKHKKRKISGCEETSVVSDVNNDCSDGSNGTQLNNKMKSKQRVDNEISTSSTDMLHYAHKAKRNKKSDEYLASRDNMLDKSKSATVNQDLKLDGVDNTQENFDPKKLIQTLLNAQKKTI